MISKITLFIRSHRVLSGVLLGVTVLLGAFVLWPKQEELPELFKVTKGDVAQKVAVTGTVKAAQDVSLAFERSGTVSRLYVSVGASVVPGQILAELSNADVIADRVSAEANVNAEKARLAELRRGARAEELKVQESRVQSAEVALVDARQGLQDKVADSYTRSEDAVRNSIDQFFNSPRGTSPKLVFAATEADLRTLIESERFKVEEILGAWKTRTAQLKSDPQSIAESAQFSRDSLQAVKNFLEHVAQAVNALTTASFSQTTIDSYRASVSSARTSVNTAIVNLSTAEEKVRSADSSLALAKRELELSRAGSSSEQIAVQEARVAQAEAELLGRSAQVGKTILRSPIYGIVTRVNPNLGESVSAQSPVILLISRSNYQIEAQVPEADIAKIAVGQKAEVTLDAYDQTELFPAHVVAIDPAETLVDGVPTYKATLQFEKKDERVRPGMTANIDVLANQKTGVLYVPARAVASKDTGRVVQMVLGGKIVEVPVVIGIRGSDGSVEILEGLKEGDEVVISARTE